MMRLQLGAVLITLQLCFPVGVHAQESDDIATCYIDCRDTIQDSNANWSCSGTQECNCRTPGYLARLGCCMQDRCDLPSSQAIFQIPCSPDEDDEDGGGGITYAEASCSRSSSGSASATGTGARTTPTGMGINAVPTTAVESGSEEEASSSTMTTDTSTAAGSEETTSSGGDSDGSNNGGGSNSNALALGLGLGLGIPLTLAVIGIIAFLFYRTRQRNRNSNNAQNGDGSPRHSLNPQRNPFASPPPGVHELFSPTDTDALPLANSNNVAGEGIVSGDGTAAAAAAGGGSGSPTRSHNRTPSNSGSGIVIGASRTSHSTSGRRSRDARRSPAPRGGSNQPQTTATGQVNGTGPRTWDSRSTLVSNVPAAHGTTNVATNTNTEGGIDRRGSGRPSRSLRSATPEMMMRELPDLPPSARTRGARSPDITSISELP